MIDEDERTEEEITTVHAGELPRPMPGGARPAPSASMGPEGTVRLRGGGVPAGPREETVVLTNAPASTERLRPSDSGWGTVVLPGGGHPLAAEDRTQLLAMDEPEPERDPAAAISTTARLSVGAPEPFDMADSASLTGILPPRADVAPAWSRGSGTAPPSDAAATIPLLRKGSTAPPTEAAGSTEPPIEARTTTVFVAPTLAGRAAPSTEGAAIAPEAGSQAPAERSIMPPTGNHPPAGHPLSRTGRTAIMSTTGGNPLASGQSPVVGFTPTGGSPIVPRPGGRPQGRPPGRGPTGAHAGLHSSDGNARLAWGFLLGVLLTVGILAAAGALALYLLG